jgi:hypothetical protein
MANGGSFAMGTAIAVRSDYTSQELRGLAVRVKDAAQARRLLAIDCPRPRRFGRFSRRAIATQILHSAALHRHPDVSDPGVSSLGSGENVRSRLTGWHCRKGREVRERGLGIRVPEAGWRTESTPGALHRVPRSADCSSWDAWTFQP